jgi:tRNA(His) 5'-end guanylyltransferase
MRTMQLVSVAYSCFSTAFTEQQQQKHRHEQQSSNINVQP